MSEQSQKVQASLPATTAADSTTSDAENGGSFNAVRAIIIFVGVLIGLIVIGFVAALIWALASPGAADNIQVMRDFFIIVLALEGILIGAALIILILQIARLTNLLQNEIKPILEQTGDTVKTVKGTATFVSRNVADPVIKAGGFVAWLGAMLREIVGIFRIIR
jgi:hypothetical protein